MSWNTQARSKTNNDVGHAATESLLVGKEGVGVIIKEKDKLRFTNPKSHFLVDRKGNCRALCNANRAREEIDIIRVGVLSPIKSQQGLRPGVDLVHGKARKESAQDTSLTNT